MDLPGDSEDNSDNASSGITLEGSLAVGAVYCILILLAALLNLYIARVLHHLPQPVKRSVNDYLVMYWSAACAVYSLSFLPIRVVRIIYSAIFFQGVVAQVSEVTNMSHLTVELSHVSNKQYEDFSSTQSIPSDYTGHSSFSIFEGLTTTVTSFTTFSLNTVNEKTNIPGKKFIEVLCWINFIGEVFIIAFFLSLIIMVSILRGLYVVAPIFMFNISVLRWARRLLAGTCTFAVMVMVSFIFDPKWLDKCTGILVSDIPNGQEKATPIRYYGYISLLILVCGLNFGIYGAILVYLTCIRGKSRYGHTGRATRRLIEPVHAIPLIANIIQSFGYLCYSVIGIIMYYSDSSANEWIQNNLPTLLATFIFMVLTPCLTLFTSHRIRLQFLKDVAPLMSLLSSLTTRPRSNEPVTHAMEPRNVPNNGGAEANSTDVHQEHTV